MENVAIFDNGAYIYINNVSSRFRYFFPRIGLHYNKRRYSDFIIALMPFDISTTYCNIVTKLHNEILHGDIYIVTHINREQVYPTVFIDIPLT